MLRLLHLVLNILYFRFIYFYLLVRLHIVYIMVSRKQLKGDKKVLSKVKAVIEAEPYSDSDDFVSSGLLLEPQKVVVLRAINPRSLLTRCSNG